MGDITFITGGARSGKSRFAEGFLDGKDRVLYIATAIPFDGEMRERIALHRSRRNKNWQTLEAYRDLGSAIAGSEGAVTHILVDCLTIMVSNLMTMDTGIDWDRADADAVHLLGKSVSMEVTGLIDGARRFNGSTIIVSNETGMGIVPAYPLGRHFRDFSGIANQAVAAAADRVYLMVSGIPVKIKGE